MPTKPRAAGASWTEQLPRDGHPGDRPARGQNNQGAVAVVGDAPTRPQAAVPVQGRVPVGSSNEPPRGLSPGNDGAVRQSNVATSNATAGELERGEAECGPESAELDGGCKPDGIQAIGQQGKSSQFASASLLPFSWTLRTLGARSGEEPRNERSSEPKRNEGRARRFGEHVRRATSPRTRSRGR